MDNTLVWVIITNAVVWIGLGAYLIFLALQQHDLAARLTQWETLRHG